MKLFLRYSLIPLAIIASTGLLLAQSKINLKLDRTATAKAAKEAAKKKVLKQLFEMSFELMGNR